MNATVKPVYYAMELTIYSLLYVQCSVKFRMLSSLNNNSLRYEKDLIEVMNV
jgi:hypothetical protein